MLDICAAFFSLTHAYLETECLQKVAQDSGKNYCLRRQGTEGQGWEGGYFFIVYPCEL